MINSIGLKGVDSISLEEVKNVKDGPMRKSRYKITCQLHIRHSCEKVGALLALCTLGTLLATISLASSEEGAQAINLFGESLIYYFHGFNNHIEPQTLDIINTQV